MSKPTFGRGASFGFGNSGPTPNDLWALIGILFVTFSLRFFSGAEGLIRQLELSPGVWQNFSVWRLFTYPFVGLGSGIFFLLELWILWMFASTIRKRLGRKNFWSLVLSATVVAALAAVAVQLVLGLLGLDYGPPFVVMQGHRILLAIMIAAFAVLHANATILLFFVLPIQARYFLWLEILFAFLAFLPTKDFAGFVGICVAVGWTWLTLKSARGRGGRGGAGGGLKELRLRLEKWAIERKLANLRKKSKLKVVRDGESMATPKPDRSDDSWIN